MIYKTLYWRRTSQPVRLIDPPLVKTFILTFSFQTSIGWMLTYISFFLKLSPPIFI